MVREKEVNRINAIKIKKPFFWTECSICGKEYRHESMFKVQRWGVNQTVHDWWYCNHCMSSKEDVLNEVDSDECYFGIAYVDSFIGFNKKNKDRINKTRDEFIKLATQKNSIR
jgi:hypothetical protein